MQLNDKSAGVLLGILSELTKIQLKNSELEPLFDELKKYFIIKDKYHVIWSVNLTRGKLDIDFERLNDILGE